MKLVQLVELVKLKLVCYFGLNRRRLVRGAIAVCGIAIDFIRAERPPGDATLHPALLATQRCPSKQHSRVF